MKKNQDAGYRMQDTGYRIQDAGYRIQDTGCKLHDITQKEKYRVGDTWNNYKFRYTILNTGYNKENTGSQDTIKSTQDTGNIDTGFISKNNYFRCQDLNHKSLQYRCSSKHNCRKYPGIFL